MKKHEIKNKILLTSIVFLLFVLPALSYGAKGGVKSNMKSICMSCHEQVKDFTKKSNVHSPVKKGNCVACHNPHASKHEKLLSDDINDMCFKCHSEKSIAGGQVVHGPVEQGTCIDCHDPHSVNGRKLIKKEGECYSCHKKDSIESGKHLHSPVKKGQCNKCHLPHSGARDDLLKKSPSKLCLNCHKPKASTHTGFNVNKSDCSLCHSTHSSNEKNLVKSFVHKPFKDKQCNSCHKAGTMEVKDKSSNLCLKCHKDSLKTFNKTNSHLVPFDGNLCIQCHNPHGGDTKSMIWNRVDKNCYKCHEDSKEKMKTKEFVHSNIKDCLSCHKGHGTNERLFIVAKEGNTCYLSGCHTAQGTFTHPVGDKAIDPRSKEPMTCNTCHNPMGAQYENQLRLDETTDLCVQCHQI